MSKWRRLNKQARARRWRKLRGILRALAFTRAYMVAATTMAQIQMVRCARSATAADQAMKALRVASLTVCAAKEMEGILREAPRGKS